MVMAVVKVMGHNYAVFSTKYLTPLTCVLIAGPADLQGGVGGVQGQGGQGGGGLQGGVGEEGGEGGAGLPG